MRPPSVLSKFRCGSMTKVCLGIMYKTDCLVLGKSYDYLSEGGGKVKVQKSLTAVPLLPSSSHRRKRSEG